MKEFHLSSSGERIAGISFSAVMVVCFGVLLYALRNNLTLLLLCGLAIVFITALLVFYVVSILKARCVLDPQAKTLEVKGFPAYTKDLSQATLLQTLPRKSGHTVVRCLVFSDPEDTIVAAVPTLFTYRQGILAEPMAKEMAALLGIHFKENIPAWEYDKEKFKEHQKEVAEQEKADRLARRQAFKDKLMGKTPRKPKK